LLVVLLVAWAGLFWSTRHGVGVGNDSPAFTMPAQIVASGGKFVSIHHPPLFPAAMTLLVAMMGVSTNAALLSLQFVALTIVIAMVWWLLRWATRNDAAALAGASLVGWSYPIVNQSGWADTALWGAAWSISALAFICRYRAEPIRKAWLVGAMFAAACALLTRYAGFTSVMLVATVIWWRRKRPFGIDFVRALIAGFVVCVPCGLQILHNHRVHANATGRTFAWNGIAWDRVRESFATLAQWHLPTAAASWISGLFLIALATGVLLVRGARTDHPSLVLRTSALFYGVFLSFHVAVIATLDFWLALDTRVLLPLLPITIIFGTIAVLPLLESGRPLLRFGLAAVVILYAGLALQRTIKLCTSYSILGRGDTALTFRQSGLENFVHRQVGKVIVTNNPAFLFNLTGATGQGLPITWNLFTNRPEPQAEQELARMTQACRSRDTLFVIFESADNPARVPWTSVALPRAPRRVFHDYFVSVYSNTPQVVETADARNGKTS
jgi:hypothetical protein